MGGAQPAHPLPNIFIQFIQANSHIKSTLMFNVPGTEISVHAEFSHCRQNSHVQQHIWHYRVGGPSMHGREAASMPTGRNADHVFGPNADRAECRRAECRPQPLGHTKRRRDDGTTGQDDGTIIRYKWTIAHCVSRRRPRRST